MDVRKEVVELGAPLADELGFEIVDVEYVPAGRRWTVRVYIDRPGGVRLEDCARFSRRLGDLLEMNQTLPHAYVIEVSSPGIERRLRTADHFRRALGQRVHVDAHEPVDGRRHVEGVVRDADDRAITLGLDDGGRWTVPLAGVKSARLIVDPWEGLRPERPANLREPGSVRKERGRKGLRGRKGPRPRATGGNQESERA